MRPFSFGHGSPFFVGCGARSFELVFKAATHGRCCFGLAVQLLEIGLGGISEFFLTALLGNRRPEEFSECLGLSEGLGDLGLGCHDLSFQEEKAERESDGQSYDRHDASEQLAPSCSSAL
jgi:hypothetical protein